MFDVVQVSSRIGEMLNSSSRSHRSGNNGQVSNQMVPYGKGQSSTQMGDVSLALAFAFENGGKLRRNDSIMGFLHQINFVSKFVQIRFFGQAGIQRIGIRSVQHLIHFKHIRICVCRFYGGIREGKTETYRLSKVQDQRCSGTG